MSRSRIAPAVGFFLYGACALIAQLLCLQELLIVFAGHELFLGFSLAAWMGWVGMGSWLAGRRQANALPLLVGWAIPVLLANLVAIRLSKCLFGFGMLVGLWPMLVLTTILLAPVGLVVGALFSWGCAWSKAHVGFGVGQAYLWETLGAAAGGICYSWLIAGRMSAEWTVIVLAVPAAMVTRTLLKPRKRLFVFGMLALSLAFAATPLASWTRRLQWRGYTLIDERLSRYSHLVLAKTGSLTNLFDNGLIAAHFPDPAAYEELVHWPLLAHPAPRRILIIGGAATGSLAELLKHPVAQVDYVELDPTVIRLVKPVLTSADRAALDDPHLRLIHQDGRRFLAHTENRYDVILLQFPEPRNAQINRLYTLEAFREIRARLAPGGLLAFTVPSSENYLSPETLYFNACLFQTLRAVFPTVELIAGDPLLLLASPNDAPLDLATLIQRYTSRGLRTREVVPSYMPIKLDARRRAALISQLTSARLPLNLDFSPVCYAYAWRVWLAKFVSPLYFLGMLGFIALFAWLVRATWRRRVLLAKMPGQTALCVLGCAGIVYETVLLLAFQAINGYVYWQLGFLFAAFMIGLALGSGLAVRFLLTLNARQTIRWLRLLVVVTGLEGVLLAWLLPTLQRLPVQFPLLVPFSGLLFVSALWLGLAFPLASRLEPDRPVGHVAGSLYAADLWGASLGALITGAFAIPLIGLIATVGIMGCLLFLAAWLLPRDKIATPRQYSGRFYF